MLQLFTWRTWKAGVKRWALCDGGQQKTLLDGLLELIVTTDWLVSGLNFQVLVYQVSEIAREMKSEHAELAVQDQ